MQGLERDKKPAELGTGGREMSDQEWRWGIPGQGAPQGEKPEEADEMKEGSRPGCRYASALP